MCIFHSLENLFHVAAYIQGGGGDNILSSERGTYERNSILSGWGKNLGLQKGRHGKGPTHVFEEI